MKLLVAIVEDDQNYRGTIAHAVLSAPDMTLVGVAGDVSAGRVLLDNKQPEVLLVDLGLPSGSGLELIRYAAQQLPACDVMVISVFGDERHVLAAIQAGATGYLLKDAPNSDLTDQIRALHAGGSPISPVIARQLLRRFSIQDANGSSSADNAADDTPALSPQEHKVLLMCSKGYTYEEVARMISVSRQTVQTYVKRLYHKLQVHTKTEAVYEARRKGWLKD